MSVVEDFFERFEKGELRTVEAEYVGTDDDNTHTTDANGQLAVTVSDLVSVEDAVSVLVADPDNDGEYIDVDVAATDGVSVCKGTADIDEFDADAGGDSNTDALEDNQIGITFYNGDLAVVDADDLPDFKVIARGY